MSDAELVIVAVPARQRKYRGSIPEAHRKSLDTRLAWLWHQRFGTVQTIWQKTDDTFDRTACMLVLQAIMAKDLESIRMIFDRLEGGALEDVVLLEREDGVLKL